MAVSARISTGIKLECDRAGGTTYETVFATVDFNFAQRAPRQEKTAQLTTASAIGIRSFLPGLRERELSFSLRFDLADSQTGFTHQEMWADFVAGVKGNWRVTYPPTGGTPTTPTYTGARTRVFKGVITGFHVRGGLGTVVTAELTLQMCGTVTEGTAA